MWNRAVSIFSGDDAGRSADQRPWETDRRPARRLAVLFLALTVPCGVVFGRLWFLQSVLSPDRFDSPGETSVTYEWIPARNGRILSADGRILAEDVVRYEVQAHYRWLEDPPDAGWLRQRALHRLTESERRNRNRVRREQRRVLSERDEMWDRLANLTQQNGSEISRRRDGVQRRIERMLATVNDRRIRRWNAKAEKRNQPADDSDENGLTRFWRRLVTTLTTQPRRHYRDPLILPEQSDYHRLLDDVPPDVAAEIQAHPELYPGLRVHITARRHYPQGSLAPHLIGYRKREFVERDAEGPAEERPPGLVPRPRSVGKTGLENSYEETLRGVPGWRRVHRNSRGEILRTEVVRRPVAGRDVVLTLNSGLQQQLQRLLDQRLADAQAERGGAVSGAPPRGGCLVVLDVHTGAILAAVSAPRFDLNAVVNHDPRRWREWTADPRRPFFPRAIRMALPPGSVFKTVTATAALESGRIDPDAKLHCQGFLDRPTKHRCYIYRHFGVGHGDLTLGDAVCRSCNVYFFTAARRLGPQPLVDWAQRFGFGRPTGVDLPGEQPGHLPQPLRGNDDRPWYPGDTLGLAIGQSRLTATPLQIARMMAAVANNGKLVTPHLLGRIGTARRATDDAIASTRFDPQPVPGLKDSTLRRLRNSLRRVVQDPRGTGYKTVRLAGVEIAGKTGTAEVGGGKPDHAWFAGYVPARKPRVAFAVVLEHAGSGGKNAGPVARQLVQTLLETGVIRTTRTAHRD